MNKDGAREFGFACDLEVEDHRSGSMIVAVVLPKTENCFMVWIILIAAAITLTAGLSIWGTLEEYEELATQYPTFETLVCYTGIGERSVFVKLLGKPDEFDCFYVPTYKLATLPRSEWHSFIESPYLDASCIFASGMSLLIWPANPSLASTVLAMAAVIQVIGYVRASFLVYRSDLWSELMGEASDSDTQSNLPEDEIH